MSNSSNRTLALEIETKFRSIFEALGFAPVPPVPIIDPSDETLLFTGATINAVKSNVVSGSLPVPGHLLEQDCVRLQNLKRLGDTSFLPEYMSCFRMFSVCASPLGRQALALGVRAFLSALRERWGSSIILSSHTDQSSLLQGFAIEGISDSVQMRAHPMTWSYGIGDLLTGAGVDIQIGGDGVPRSTGQLVELFGGGETVGFEFGFGLETLGAAVAGCLGPFDCAQLADVIDIEPKPLFLQTVDVVTTLSWLSAAGLSPGHDARGSTMRKMLRVLPAIAENAGLDLSRVKYLLNHLRDCREENGALPNMDMLSDLVSTSWDKRTEALMLSKAYVDNQMRLAASGTQSGEQANVRIRAYLNGLGKLLPSEIDGIVHGLHHLDDKSGSRTRSWKCKLNEQQADSKQMNKYDAAAPALEQGYRPSEIEPKWQAIWEADHTYATSDNQQMPKCYVLDMFPYPSGTSMHVGHPRGYVATDAYSRFKRMSGFRVLHPMGWDSFGLPAEETAIARQEYPSITVDRNIEQFKGQLQRLGLSYDWDREVKTTDPTFYRHTQRLFLEFFRRGLAYNSVTKVNWCAALGTVLANEDIVNGVSERGGHPVELLPMRQWMLRITAYADRLVQDLDGLPLWPESVKNAQREWIGRSEGHEISFPIVGMDFAIKAFTTRLETVSGATFVAIAPEGEQAMLLTSKASNSEEAKGYIARVRARTERDRRTSATKSGLVVQGVVARNPMNGETIPVVLADYVIDGYGTGAVMGVPAHDDRDAEFANELGLPVRTVIDADGRLVNSGALNGMSESQGREEIARMLGVSAIVQFKMRDWVFSRQRFWGEPIPVVWIKGAAAYQRFECGAVSEWLPEAPVTFEGERGEQFFAVPIIPKWLDAARLPVVDKYQPTGRAEGPLAGLPSWVNVWIDPASGEISDVLRGEPWVKASRETNTMPQWAGSSWYWLRFMDPSNLAEPFSMDAVKSWGPVDLYAGADHAVAHLLYARFWQKVLFDANLVNHAEPFKRLEFLGYVLASDGSKISKRSNNSRNPDEVIADVGADAFRLYEMAIGPFEKAVPWNDEGLTGQYRFLNRVYAACERVLAEEALQSDDDVSYLLHRAIATVGNDIEAFKFNTAVAALMIFLKESQGMRISIPDYRTFVQLMAPFAPHIGEELWQKLGGTGSVHRSEWPQVNQEAFRRAEVIVPVQINGKRRAEVVLPSGATEAIARQVALEQTEVRRWTDGRQIMKFVFVTNRIINIVVSDTPT